MVLRDDETFANTESDLHQLLSDYIPRYEQLEPEEQREMCKNLQEIMTKYLQDNKQKENGDNGDNATE